MAGEKVWIQEPAPSLVGYTFCEGKVIGMTEVWPSCAFDCAYTAVNLSREPRSYSIFTSPWSVCTKDRVDPWKLFAKMLPEVGEAFGSG